MENARYRECLAVEFALLRATVANADSDRQVPSCPDWQVKDLTTHVAEVYLHKLESMRRGAFPEPWPPDLSGEQPLALLDRAYSELAAEFDARSPEQPTAHWYEPDSTVGCLVRRMAQETVIHRVDAELAAGGPVSPIPADLAVDGIDEVLVVMLAFMAQHWPQAFADLPGEADPPPAPVQLNTGEHSWLVTATPRGVTIAGAGPADLAVAAISGEPDPMLRWLWGRAGDEVVTMTGDPAELTRLRGLLREATQ